MSPPLPYLQFAVLGVLLPGDKAGRVIRLELERLDVRKSGPAFYRLMSRLEEAGLVEGWYEQDVVEGQILRERHYRVTAAGRGRWDATRAFHSAVIATGSEGRALISGWCSWPNSG